MIMNRLGAMKLCTVVIMIALIYGYDYQDLWANSDVSPSDSQSTKRPSSVSESSHSAQQKVIFFDKVVAGVGGQSILLSEVKKKMEVGPLVLVHDYPASPDSSSYERALHDAINFAVMASQASALEIEVTSQEVETQIEVILTAQKATKADLKAYLLSQNLTLFQYTQDLKDQILVQKFQARVIAPKARLSDQRVRETYQKQFQTSPYDDSLTFVQAKLVDPGRSDEQLQAAALELYQKIRTKELSFVDLDSDPMIQLTAQRQVYVSELASDISSAVTNLNPLEVSPPVKVGDHWSLLFIQEKKPGLKPHFLAQKLGVLQQLRMNDMGQFLRSWLAEERSKRNIFVSSYRP